MTRLKVRGYRGTGFGSGFIKWFTRGEFSHVSLIFEFKDYSEEVESIQGKGVIRHVPRTDGVFVEMVVPVTQEQIIEAHVLALGLLGTEYDWKGIYGFIVRRDRQNKEKWFCSELVAYILYKIGHRLSRREPYRETPSMVMESLRLIEGF